MQTDLDKREASYSNEYVSLYTIAIYVGNSGEQSETQSLSLCSLWTGRRD